MNILYLGISFRLGSTTDKVGGGEISNRLLLQELSKKHNVYVFSAYGSDMWGEEYNGIKMYDLSSKLKWLGSLSIFSSKILFRFFYYFYAHKIMPDIILCGPNTVSLSLFLSKKLNVPAGCFIRAFENFSIKNEKLKDKVIKLLKTVTYGGFKRKSINKLDFLLPNSEFMLRECKKEFDCKFYHVVYPPLDINKHAFLIPKRIKNIVMVSNLEHKGFNLFKSISERFLDINFTAVGVTGITSVKKISKNLFFEGWQKKPQDFILKADLVLVPSLWEEPFGRIAVEALCCGRMVIVSDKGGLPETVNYNDSIILPSDDLQQWISKINLIIKSPFLFEKDYENAVSNVDMFSLPIQAERFEFFLKKQISSSF